MSEQLNLKNVGLILLAVGGLIGAIAFAAWWNREPTQAEIAPEAKAEVRRYVDTPDEAPTNTPMPVAIDAPPTETELEALRLQAKIRAEEERDRPRREREEAKAAKKAAAEATKTEAREAKQEEIAESLRVLFRSGGIKDALIGIDENDLIIGANGCDRKVLTDLRKTLKAFDLDPATVFDNLMCNGGDVLPLKRR